MWRQQQSGFAQLLLGELQRQQQSSHHCDILLETEGVSVPAHSCILAALSPIFSRALSTSLPLSAGQSRLVKIQAVRGQALIRLVGFLYSGEMEGDVDEREEVEAAACRLGFSQLVTGKRESEKRGDGWRKWRNVGVQTEGMVNDSTVPVLNERRKCRGSQTSTASLEAFVASVQHNNFLSEPECLSALHSEADLISSEFSKEISASGPVMSTDSIEVHQSSCVVQANVLEGVQTLLQVSHPSNSCHPQHTETSHETLHSSRGKPKKVSRLRKGVRVKRRRPITVKNAGPDPLDLKPSDAAKEDQAKNLWTRGDDEKAMSGQGGTRPLRASKTHMSLKVRLMRKRRGSLWEVVGAQEAGGVVTSRGNRPRPWESIWGLGRPTIGSVKSALQKHNSTPLKGRKIQPCPAAPQLSFALTSPSGSCSSPAFEAVQSNVSAPNLWPKSPSLRKPTLTPNPTQDEEPDEQIEQLLEDIMIDLNILPPAAPERNCDEHHLCQVCPHQEYTENDRGPISSQVRDSVAKTTGGSMRQTKAGLKRQKQDKCQEEEHSSSNATASNISPVVATPPPSSSSSSSSLCNFNEKDPSSNIPSATRNFLHQRSDDMNNTVSHLFWPVENNLQPVSLKQTERNEPHNGNLQRSQMSACSARQTTLGGKDSKSAQIIKTAAKKVNAGKQHSSSAPWSSPHHPEFIPASSVHGKPQHPTSDERPDFSGTRHPSCRSPLQIDNDNADLPNQQPLQTSDLKTTVYPATDGHIHHPTQGVSAFQTELQFHKVSFSAKPEVPPGDEELQNPTHLLASHENESSIARPSSNVVKQARSCRTKKMAKRQRNGARVMYMKEPQAGADQSQHVGRSRTLRKRRSDGNKAKLKPYSQRDNMCGSTSRTVQQSGANLGSSKSGQTAQSLSQVSLAFSRIMTRQQTKNICQRWNHHSLNRRIKNVSKYSDHGVQKQSTNLAKSAGCMDGSSSLSKLSSCRENIIGNLQSVKNLVKHGPRGPRKVQRNRADLLNKFNQTEEPAVKAVQRLSSTGTSSHEPVMACTKRWQVSEEHENGPKRRKNAAVEEVQGGEAPERTERGATTPQGKRSSVVDQVFHQTSSSIRTMANRPVQFGRQKPHLVLQDIGKCQSVEGKTSSCPQSRHFTLKKFKELLERNRQRCRKFGVDSSGGEQEEHKDQSKGEIEIMPPGTSTNDKPKKTYLNNNVTEFNDELNKPLEDFGQVDRFADENKLSCRVHQSESNEKCASQGISERVNKATMDPACGNTSQISLPEGILGMDGMIPRRAQGEAIECEQTNKELSRLVESEAETDRWAGPVGSSSKVTVMELSRLRGTESEQAASFQAEVSNDKTIKTNKQDISSDECPSEEIERVEDKMDTHDFVDFVGGKVEEEQNAVERSGAKVKIQRISVTVANRHIASTRGWETDEIDVEEVEISAEMDREDEAEDKRQQNYKMAQNTSVAAESSPSIPAPYSINGGSAGNWEDGQEDDEEEEVEVVDVLTGSPVLPQMWAMELGIKESPEDERLIEEDEQEDEEVDVTGEDTD